MWSGLLVLGIAGAIFVISVYIFARQYSTGDAPQPPAASVVPVAEDPDPAGPDCD